MRNSRFFFQRRLFLFRCKQIFIFILNSLAISSVDVILFSVVVEKKWKKDFYVKLLKVRRIVKQSELLTELWIYQKTPKVIGDIGRGEI